MDTDALWKPLIGFTAPSVWGDEYYSLTLDFSEPSATKLGTAAEVLWSAPDLQGCWLHSDREPTDEHRVSARVIADARDHGPPNLHGLARIPGGFVLPCLSNFGLAPDYMFLQLALNAAALRAVPLEDQSHCGLPLVNWLADLARRVHRTAPFRVGVIGWEAFVDNPEKILTEQEPTRGYLHTTGETVTFTPPTLLFPPRTNGVWHRDASNRLSLSLGAIDPHAAIGMLESHFGATRAESVIDPLGDSQYLDFVVRGSTLTLHYHHYSEWELFAERPTGEPVLREIHAYVSLNPLPKTTDH